MDAQVPTKQLPNDHDDLNTSQRLNVQTKKPPPAASLDALHSHVKARSTPDEATPAPI